MKLPMRRLTHWLSNLRADFGEQGVAEKAVYPSDLCPLVKMTRSIGATSPGGTKTCRS
jgi:hypothetical protein